MLRLRLFRIFLSRKTDVISHKIKNSPRKIKRRANPKRIAV